MPTITRSILIVDDIEADRKMLREILQAEGYHLLEAADGSTALKLAADARPDLVLLDTTMPGMDGFEVCRRLRAAASTAAIPVVMVVATPDDHAAWLTGIEAGADNVVSKRINPAELRALARTITRLDRYARLRQAEERIGELAELLELSPDAIIVCDPAQRITYWNAAAGRLYGFTAAEAIGQRADVLLFRGETADAPDLEPLSNDDWCGEITQVTRDEKEIIVNSRRRLLRDAAGRPVAILTINAGLTGKTQLESIAHDLNNTLAASLLGISGLRARLTDPDDRELLEMLQASTERGARLVGQVLGSAEDGGGQMTSRAASAGGAPQDSPRGGGEHVLIVDDDDSILMIVGAILTEIGYEVLTATDGIGAMEIFNAHKDRIRLVITDGKMPRSDGVQFARSIHELAPEVPIILMTGLRDRSLPDDGSIAELLRKPFTTDALLQAVRRVTGSRTPG